VVEVAPISVIEVNATRAFVLQCHRSAARSRAATALAAILQWMVLLART